jgi:hypothetical protein
MKIRPSFRGKSNVRATSLAAAGTCLVLAGGTISFVDLATAHTVATVASGSGTSALAFTTTGPPA